MSTQNNINNNNSSIESEQFKAVKDSLVSSLFELSKAATEVSKNAIDYFNLIHSSNDSTTNLNKSESKKLIPLKKPIKSNSTTLNETEISLPSPPSPSNIDSITPIVEEKKLRRKKIPRDPNAPKKPLTSYILFYNHLRASVAEKNSELSQTDIAREISHQWKEMSDDDKNYWKSLYEKEKVKYHAAMIKYNASKEDEEHQNDENTSISKKHVSDENDDEIEEVESSQVIESPKKKKSKKAKKSK